MARTGEIYAADAHRRWIRASAFLVNSLLKDVLNRGTGASVRARGFTLPLRKRDLARRMVRGSLPISFA